MDKMCNPRHNYAPLSTNSRNRNTRRDDYLVSASAKYLPVTTLRFNNDRRYASLVNSKLVPDTVVSDAVNFTCTGAGVDGPCSSSARAFSEPDGSPNVDNSVSSHTNDVLSVDLHSTCAP
ncbi:unnamed protein product [Sphagnum balticum]